MAPDFCNLGNIRAFVADDTDGSSDDEPAGDAVSVVSSTASAVRGLNLLNIQRPVQPQHKPKSKSKQRRAERRAALFADRAPPAEAADPAAIGRAILAALAAPGASSSSAPPAPRKRAASPPPTKEQKRALIARNAAYAAEKAAARAVRQLQRQQPEGAGANGDEDY